MAGLAFLEMVGKNTKWVRRAVGSRALREAIRARGSTVRVGVACDWYYAIWQEFLADAAFACFVLLALLAPVWVTLTNGSVELGLLAGLVCLKVGWDVRTQVRQAI